MPESPIHVATRKSVLMPCRALEAFRLVATILGTLVGVWVCLNALSGIGGVQTRRFAMTEREDLFFGS